MVPSPTVYQPFQVELKSLPKLSSVEVEVSTSNLPGQDGSLADDFFVDRIHMSPSDAFPGTYTGKNGATAQWYRTPRTYYWQVKAHCSTYMTECGGSGYPDYTSRDYLSEVRTVTVVAPAAPPGGGGNTETPAGIRRSDVAAYVRIMLRRETDGTVRRLARECSGVLSPTVTCYLTWRIGRYRYQGTVRLENYIEGGEGYWQYTFRGTKKKVGCRSCRAKRVRW